MHGAIGYRIVLACDGVPESEGPQAAANIYEEFKKRSWHRMVACKWDGQSVTLSAENDFDVDGSALKDEFSDAVSAGVRQPFTGNIRIVSITKF